MQVALQTKQACKEQMPACSTSLLYNATRWRHACHFGFKQIQEPADYGNNAHSYHVSNVDQKANLWTPLSLKYWSRICTCFYEVHDSSIAKFNTLYKFKLSDSEN